MMRKLAQAFGVTLTVIGLAGFCSWTTQNGMLFGYLAVDWVHNLGHLTAGLLGLVAGVLEKRYARLYFKGLGIAFVTLGFLGAYYGDAPLFGFMAYNVVAMWAHFVLAASAFYVAYLCPWCND